MIDFFIKYAWVNPLKGETVLNTFFEIVNESYCKLNKLCVDQGRELYNRFIQKCLYDTDILMHSAHECKPVVAKIFIKTLKGKIYKRRIANDSKSYLSYLNKLVDQYNNTYYHSIDKKPINADYSALTDKIETNPKALKFKVIEIVRITKYNKVLVNVTLKTS